MRSRSIEELRNLQQDIEATFNFFTDYVVKQVDFLRSDGASQEAKKLIELMNSIKVLYKPSIQKIHERSEALFDDNWHSLSLSSHPNKTSLCECITNPPGGSHFGGCWERAIGSIRKIIDSSLWSIGPRAITCDELDTLFKVATSIIDNIPLYQISVDHNDPFPIFPTSLMLLKDNPNSLALETFFEADLNCYDKLRWCRI